MRRIVILDRKGHTYRYTVQVFSEWSDMPYIAYAGNSHKAARTMANAVQGSIMEVSGMEIAITGDIQ